MIDLIVNDDIEEQRTLEKLEYHNTGDGMIQYLDTSVGREIQRKSPMVKVKSYRKPVRDRRAIYKKKSP